MAAFTTFLGAAGAASKFLGGGKSQSLTPREKFEQRGFTKTFMRKLEAYRKGRPETYGSQFRITLKAWDEQNGTKTRFGKGSQPVTVKRSNSSQAASAPKSAKAGTTRIDPDKPDKSKILGIPVGWAIGLAGLILTVAITIFRKPKRRKRRR